MTVSCHGVAGGASSSQSNDVSTTTHFGIASASSSSSTLEIRVRAGARDVRKHVGALPADRAFDRLRVRIDQELVRVEAAARRRVVRAVHAIAVQLARADVRQVAVPVEGGALDERDARLGPAASNRHSSTRSAFSEKSEKFVPAPSQVAPSGNGVPGQTMPVLSPDRVALHPARVRARVQLAVGIARDRADAAERPRRPTPRRRGRARGARRSSLRRRATRPRRAAARVSRG